MQETLQKTFQTLHEAVHYYHLFALLYFSPRYTIEKTFATLLFIPRVSTRSDDQALETDYERLLLVSRLPEAEEIQGPTFFDSTPALRHDRLDLEHSRCFLQHPLLHIPPTGTQATHTRRTRTIPPSTSLKSTRGH